MPHNIPKVMVWLEPSPLQLVIPKIVKGDPFIHPTMIKGDGISGTVAFGISRDPKPSPLRYRGMNGLSDSDII